MRTVKLGITVLSCKPNRSLLRSPVLSNTFRFGHATILMAIRTPQQLIQKAIKIKGLDPLRAVNTFIRYEDEPDCTVSNRAFFSQNNGHVLRIN